MVETSLLFIHGWATDNWVWEENAKALSNGAPFKNINLPGHGGVENWSEPNLMPAIKEVSRHLKDTKGRQVIGIGWSLGAQALMALPPELLKKFKGFLMVGATPCFTERDDFKYAQSKALVKRMIIDMRTKTETTVNRFYSLNFTEDELKKRPAKDLIKRYKYPGPVSCSTDAPGCFPIFKYDEITAALGALYNVDLRPVLGNIDIPVLIVHGDDDTVCPPDAGRFLAAHIKKSDLMIFERAGHAPFLTKKEVFNKVAAEFMEGL